MKRYLVGGMLVLVLLGVIGNFDKILIGTMRLVDSYGDRTGAEVVGIIDGLNEIYYMFYE